MPLPSRNALLGSFAKFGSPHFKFRTLAYSATHQKSFAYEQHDVKYNEDGNITSYGEAEPFSSIPGPPSLPVIGNRLGYRRHPERISQRHIYLKQLQKQYGDVVKEELPTNTIVHIFKPEYIKQVFDKDGKYPSIPPLVPTVQLYRKRRDIAPGLGNSNGEEWHQLRSVLQHILVKPQTVLDYLPLQNEVADMFVEKIGRILNKDGEVDNLNRWVLRWGLKSSINTFFERVSSFEELKDVDEVITSNAHVFELSTKLFFSIPFYKYLPCPSLQEIFDHEDFIVDFGQNLLLEASKEYRDEVEGKTSTGKKHLFLSYLYGRQSMGAKDTVAVVNSILTDTLVTTTQAVLGNIYTLATNPEAQEKAYEEAKNVLPESGELTPEAFNSCTYIKAFMKETFRVHPVGIDMQRLCGSDSVIGGYQIPKGTYVNMVTYLPLQDPVYVPRPDQFLPERWLRGNELNMKTHPFLFIPFSFGTRMCVGRRFAEQELVMMIAKILRKFKLEWHHKEKVSQRFRLLQIPDREVKVKFVPRND